MNLHSARLVQKRSRFSRFCWTVGAQKVRTVKNVSHKKSYFTTQEIEYFIFFIIIILHNFHFFFLTHFMGCFCLTTFFSVLWGVNPDSVGLLHGLRVSQRVLKNARDSRYCQNMFFFCRFLQHNVIFQASSWHN